MDSLIIFLIVLGIWYFTERRNVKQVGGQQHSYGRGEQRRSSPGKKPRKGGGLILVVLLCGIAGIVLWLVYINMSATDDDDGETITGRCTGNTDSTEDVDCSGETTNKVNKGKDAKGKTVADCCKAGAPKDPPGASVSGRHIWGIGPFTEAGKNGKVYYRAGLDAKWQEVPGQFLTQVEVSGDGKHVWGVDSSSHVYYRPGFSGGDAWKNDNPTGWKAMSGGITKLSVNRDGTLIWGIGPLTGAGNMNGLVHHRAGVAGTWVQIPIGELSEVSVSGDGKHVWGVNSFGVITHRAGVAGSWDAVKGGIKQFSVNDDGMHVWGVNKRSEIFHRNGVDNRDDPSAWRGITGGGLLVQVSVSGDGKHVWGVNNDGYIYYRPGLVVEDAWLAANSSGWKTITGLPLSHVSVN